MSVNHHGAFPEQESGNEEQKRLMERFLDQASGKVKREFSQGRMGGDDDGVLAYAIAADPRHRTVVIRFGKPTEWIGLSIQDAQQLVEKLNEKIVELRTGERVSP